MSVKLTQFSKASGCGCKIAPAVLEEILKGCKQDIVFKNLLVGSETKDDAAVYELEDGNCIISTTDFLLLLSTMPLTSEKFRHAMPLAIYMRWAENL